MYFENVKQCFDAAKNNNIDQFNESMLILANLCKTRETSISHRLADLVFVCTSYNRPDMLSKCTVVRPLLRVWGSTVAAFSLAKIMEYRECLNELLKLYPPIEKRHSPIELVHQFIYLDTRRELDIVLFKKLCRELIKNDIHTINMYGRTVLHEAIVRYASYQTVSALLEIGCDVNALDNKGTTAFSQLFHIQRGMTKLEPLIKLFLMENPSTILSDGLSVYRMEKETYKATQGRKPTGQEFPLTRLLYLHGFNISCFNSHMTKEQLSLLQSTGLTSGVRKLSEICRIVLRQHYTGKAIHLFVKDANIPRKLKDYILLKDAIHDL